MIFVPESFLDEEIFSPLERWCFLCLTTMPAYRLTSPLMSRGRALRGISSRMSVDMLVFCSTSVGSKGESANLCIPSARASFYVVILKVMDDGPPADPLSEFSPADLLGDDFGAIAESMFEQILSAVEIGDSMLDCLDDGTFTVDNLDNQLVDVDVEVELDHVASAVLESLSSTASTCDDESQPSEPPRKKGRGRGGYTHGVRGGARNTERNGQHETKNAPCWCYRSV